MSRSLPTIAITAGEPAGIGPDLCVMLAHKSLNASVVVVADAEMLKARAVQLKLSLKITPYTPNNIKKHIGNGTLTVLNIPISTPVIAGSLDARNSQYVLETLKRAALGCLENVFDVMVTAPVHKGVINDAGIAFSGHTEFLAELTKESQTNTPQVVMMLVGSGLRVALATTHLALKDVPAAITQNSLETTIRILHHDLVHKFSLDNPRILVAGLNPHAGEDGYLGREEIEVINPVLEKLRAEGMQLIGALPADTLFAKHHLSKADAVLAMYHDQGLPVLKHASFGEGVNVTLGLPIIRTSVDHGTALGLAGKNSAGTGNIEIGSMLAAIELAITLANNKSKSAINS
ncbi:MAG: 4-hydroxythreonine-4-phosphate dehydrogenase PdxA [Methylotenera sp.]|uniref:4-hydroxythreonine-4-phosphate dehydrogenase PdxA n=1 Tax=Methylotenera sp. TaxID=2051956 RepID=UPI00272F704D|nr:4-hydroxythreonine-4-phosphate dehydrogenase PdxA [Methylotenera sp.]MDP1521686.1 4-hydroxythreonine-4-phosphate dehydrogenase PdxA [Methylotenera sp.]